MIVAGLALFVALAGTATAAHFISGASIRKHSIPADRLKRDTIGPAYVRESKLATVPRARLAGSALTAGSVNGSVPQKLLARQARGTALTKVADAGPTQIYAACSTTGVVRVRAVPVTSGARAHVGVISGTSAPKGQTYGVLNPGANADLDQGLATGEGSLTFVGANGSVTTATYLFSGGSSCIVAGTLLTHG